MKPSHSSLVGAAQAARRHAIAQYSGFAVGAALETTASKVYSGCNIENATYGLTMCAERVALLKALSEGEREFARIAVVTDSRDPVSPCGACRQLLWEFSGNIEVVLVNLKGDSQRVQLAELFPRPFDASLL